jgi:hypothetical protein
MYSETLNVYFTNVDYPACDFVLKSTATEY